MPTYEYDDFRVSFTYVGPHHYKVVARDETGGTSAEETFALPLSDDQLADAVRKLGQARAAGTAAAAAPTRRIVRDVGGTGGDGGDRSEVAVTAEDFGGRLATSLFTGPVGALYDSAVARARAQERRGVRLTLSLADTPELLEVPWEFLYLRPTFLASQRRTPIVRYLDVGGATHVQQIDGEVRILGVVASPKNLSALDVESERRRVVHAVEKVRRHGLVHLEWLDPATPRSLRQKLQDDTFHVLHFVGHSDYSKDSNEGFICLEDDAGDCAQVTGTVLANLLGDQPTLRLAVLNSCEGARTSLTDPYAGIATTLVKLGLPAVVAMQFEISDGAAITFAEELYTSLIGRQDPVDAAVAEARKAVLTEVNEIEWATPVLFLRNSDGALFNFTKPPPQLPALPPPTPPTTPGDGGGGGGDGGNGHGGGEGGRGKRGFWRHRPVVASVAGATAALLVAGGVWVGTRRGSEVDPGVCATTGGDRPPAATGKAAAKGDDWVGSVRDGSSGDTGLFQMTDAGLATPLTDNKDATDRNPAVSPLSNLVAFERRDPDDGDGTSLHYVIPQPAGALLMRSLVPWNPGCRDRLPAWGPDGSLIFARAQGCDAGLSCEEKIYRAHFTEQGQFLQFDDDDFGTVSNTPWRQLKSLDVDPADPTTVLLVDNRGAWTIDHTRNRKPVTGSDDVRQAVFTSDGNTVVALPAFDPLDAVSGRSLLVWAGSTQFSPQQVDLAERIDAYRAAHPEASFLPKGDDARFITMAPSSTAGDPSIAVLITASAPTSPRVVIVLDAQFDVTDAVNPVDAKGRAVSLSSLGW
jgi:hypothetical protein